MKLLKTHKNAGVFLLAFLFVLPVIGKESLLTKEYNKVYQVNPDAELKIDNKFGKIHITTSDIDAIKIHVKVEVTTRSEQKSQEMLDNIKVNFSGSSSLVSVSTSFSGKTNTTKTNYKVDYTIEMPRSNALSVRHRFGDLFLNELAGRANVELQYGDVTIGKLHSSDNQVDIKFGKGTISYLNGGDLDLKYSDVEVEEAGDLKCDTQFSKLEIGKLNKLELDSKYDTYDIGYVSEANVESEFSKLQIGSLSKSLKLENRYGAFKVEKVAKDFSLINIENQFAGIKINFEEGASFSFKGDLSFCSLESPEGWNLKKTKEGNNASSYSGKNDEKGTSRVKIESKYGGVKLQ